MLAYLPQSPGYLPYWLLFVSILSIGNSIQAYLTLHYTTQVYALAPSTTTTTTTTTNPPPTSSTIQVTPLQSRTFGTWTFLAAIVRIYAAYNIQDKRIYELALWTYGIAWAHFVSEWAVFGTARWGRGFAGPAVVATGSLLWMLGAWGGYVR